MGPLLFALLAHANAPHLSAHRTAQPPAIDGRLDDPAWQEAPATETFTQKFPDEGHAPSERTSVRVLYDDEALYVGFECEQHAAPVVARLTRRDRQVEADNVSIAIDTRRDGSSAFSFTVNAAGVLADSILFNDTESSSDWDENWDARTARTEHGWSAEFRIPLRILRFSRLPVQDWGFQARRYISARQETDEWSFIPRTEAGEVSRYGRLDNLVGLAPHSALELRPFVLGRVRMRDAVSDMIASGTDATGSAGLDLKWHVTQNLTLDATVNPDFAQVEADQLILNLTTFETYYPEKRPFFLEGIDTFATPMQVLYTRRIGRASPVPALRTDRTETLVDVPDPATIYSAAKLVGQIGGRFTIGALSALVAENDVQAQLMDGSRVTRIADPMTSFNVLRLRREVGENAYLGMVATAANHIEPLGSYPIVTGDPTMPTYQLCPSGDQTPLDVRCFHDAYVGGVDGRWRSRSGDYIAMAQALTSVMNNGPPRNLPDGTTIGSGDVGSGGLVYAAKEGGRHWIWDAQVEAYSKKVDFNDVGYLQRANILHSGLDIEYRNLEPWKNTLERHLRLELYDRENLDLLNLARGYQLNGSIKFANFWTLWSELHYRAPHFDDREVGDGTALERDGLVGWELSLHSDPRRRVSFDLFAQTQILFDGFNESAEVGVTFRLHPQLDLDVLPTVQYTFGEPRSLGTGAMPGQYVFGKLDAREIGTTVRATYTFTPRLTLQTYAQLFLVAEHYSEYSQFQATPGTHPAIRIDQLQPMTMPLGFNPDSEQAALNLNVVLRWEYRLGSTLFLVYTRSQVPLVPLADNQPASLDLGALRRVPQSDAFVLKLSYWWG